jgi:hypothetical protein
MAILNDLGRKRWSDRLPANRKGTRWDQILQVLVSYRLIGPGSEWEAQRKRGIEQQYGRARRVWVMDREVPTEAVLAEMRNSDPPVQYLMGTPKFACRVWRKNCLPNLGSRRAKVCRACPCEGGGQTAVRGQRTLCLRRECRSHQQGTRDAQTADEVAMEAAALARCHGDIARGDADEVGCGTIARANAWRLIEINMDRESSMFIYALNRQKLRAARRREGRYLLRTNLIENDPALLWQYYIQLVAVEQAFKT